MKTAFIIAGIAVMVIDSIIVYCCIRVNKGNPSEPPNEPPDSTIKEDGI